MSYKIKPVGKVYFLEHQVTKVDVEPTVLSIKLVRYNLIKLKLEQWIKVLIVSGDSSGISAIIEV